LLVGMVPWVLYNQARPIVGPRSILLVSRTDQYFTNRPGIRSAYEGAIQVLAERQCGQVGIVSALDGWEYPLKALMPSATEIEHVAVANVSADLRGTWPGFVPCALLGFGTGGASLASVDIAGQTYVKDWSAGEGVDAVVLLTAEGH
jgi:hypothetical protein